MLGSLAASAATPGPSESSAAGNSYPYLQLDVFTNRPLTGNQLAVFLEPAGLDAAAMQDIAREMNFSESTFILPKEDEEPSAHLPLGVGPQRPIQEEPSAHLPLGVGPQRPIQEETDFRVRIFGPDRELPFAGHPTIGTTFALAHTGRIPVGRDRIVLGLGIGPTSVDLTWKEGKLAFAWMTQLPPTFGKTMADSAAVAQCLGIDPSAVLSGVPVQEVSCGSAFLFVPLKTRAAVDTVSLDRRAMEALYQRAGMERRGVFVFSTEPGEEGATAYSRMLSFGVVEDPATGSASGPLGCYLVRHGLVAGANASRITSAQGVKMKRPSRIHVEIETRGEEIVRVRVGGESVLVGRGTLTV